MPPKKKQKTAKTATTQAKASGAATSTAAPTFSTAAHIASMAASAIVPALLAFGQAATTNEAESTQRAKLVKLIGNVAEADWPSTLQAAVLQAVTDFLAQHLKLETAARIAAKRLQECKASVLDVATGKANSTALQNMWQSLLQQYCPPAPMSDDLKARRRCGVKILVIGPGFGFLTNKAQIDTVERAFGAENVYQLYDPRCRSATCTAKGLLYACLPPLLVPHTLLLLRPPVFAVLSQARRMTASR